MVVGLGGATQAASAASEVSAQSLNVVGGPVAAGNLAVDLVQCGRLQDAIREYEAALRFSPEDATAHASLGELLADLGQTDEAIAQLEAAQSIRADASIVETLERLRAGQK